MKSITQYIEPITKEADQEEAIRKIEENLRRMQLEIWQISQRVTQQDHIVDADGQLADITTKFNTLLSYLETMGLLASS